MFERYYRELLNFLALKVRDRDDAADLAQESFARVYAAERAGAAIRDPRALLYRTARNLLIDEQRRAAVRQSDDGPRQDDGRLEPDEHVGPTALEPEIAVCSRQRFEAIADVVDRLPPRCREALILVKFDGLTHAQTAARMGIAIKTVEMQVQIGLQACWACLESLDDGDLAGTRSDHGRPSNERSRNRRAG